MANFKRSSSWTTTTLGRDEKNGCDWVTEGFTNKHGLKASKMRT